MPTCPPRVPTAESNTADKVTGIAGNVPKSFRSVEVILPFDA